MNRFSYQHLLLLLLTTLLHFSCSDKENNEPDIDESTTYNVQYRINIKNRLDANASDEEMMKTILLIIVNTDNVVERLIDIDLPELLEEYIVETELTQGTKAVYGFANLTTIMRTEIGINTLSEGDPMPDISDATLTIANGYEINAETENWLPMSNQLNYTVTNLTGQLFSMELVRLLCKVTFHFRNETGYTVSLEELELNPLTNSSVFLLPTDGDIPTFPIALTQGSYTAVLGSNYTFADAGEIEYTMYINETLVENSGWFRGNLITSSTEQETMINEFAITEISSLKRNDYLFLNIILTDYKLELDVRAYPPIGGYPPLITYEDDGYYCVFHGGGPFVITPTLLRQSDNEIIQDVNWSFTYEDTNPSFFDEAPVLENGEIIGVIRASAQGSVLVTLQADIITSENITRTITYRVYLVQQ